MDTGPLRPQWGGRPEHFLVLLNSQHRRSMAHLHTVLTYAVFASSSVVGPRPPTRSSAEPNRRSGGAMVRWGRVAMPHDTRCLATQVARCASLLLPCGCPPFRTPYSKFLSIRPVSSVDVFVFVFSVPCLWPSALGLALGDPPATGTQDPAPARSHLRLNNQ